MGTLYRYTIAVAALIAAVVHIAKPEFTIDATTFALVGVGILMILSRGIRVKALDLMGVKFEFDKPEVPTTIPEFPPTLEQKYPAPTSSNSIDEASIRNLTPIEMITGYAIMSAPLNDYPFHNPLFINIDWVVFAAFLTATPAIYLWSLQRRNWAAVWQTVLATTVFCGWAILLGGPFKYLKVDSSYGVFLVLLGSFIIPGFYRPSSSHKS